MTNLIENRIYCQPAMQGNQKFFVGIFTIKQILRFTRYTRRLITGYDEDNIPIYNPEVQRKLDSSRVRKVADFLVQDPEAIFPTNLVLSIPNQVIESFSQKDNLIEIVLNQKVFDEVRKAEGKGDIFITIIDGQHRIKGIETAIETLQVKIDTAIKADRFKASELLNQELVRNQSKLNHLLNFELIVSFFIDATLEYQAMIFSTINRTQKTVPPSLVYSLFGLTKEDSPQKTALQVVLALNSHKSSPFYNRINLYGADYSKNESPPLSQATMVKSIIDLISVNNREAENDRFKERKKLFKIPETSRFLPFRKYYAQNRDDIISDILFAFFKAVENTFTKNGKIYWQFDSKITKPTNVLQTTVGYEALLKILIDILKEIKEEEVDYISVYEKYLVKAKDLNFEDQQRYPFTSKSKNILYYDLSLKIWPPKANDEIDNREQKLNELLKRL